MKSSVVVDSSVWIEVIGEGTFHKKCLKFIKSYNRIIIPTVVLFEVYRKILKSTQSEDMALSVSSYLSQFAIADLNREIALLAGDLSLKHKLAMADSIVLAHAYFENCLLITLDYDFSKISGVKNLRGEE